MSKLSAVRKVFKGAVPDVPVGRTQPARLGPTTPEDIGLTAPPKVEESVDRFTDSRPTDVLDAEIDMSKQDFLDSARQQVREGKKLDLDAESAAIRHQVYIKRGVDSREPVNIKAHNKYGKKYPNVTFDRMLNKEELERWDNAFREFEKATNIDAQALNHFGELHVQHLDPDVYEVRFPKKMTSVDEIEIGSRTKLGSYDEVTASIMSRNKGTSTHLHELFHMLDGQMFAMYHKGNPKYKVVRDAKGTPTSVERTGNRMYGPQSMISEDMSEVDVPTMREPLRKAWENMRETVYNLGNEVKDGSYYERALAKDAAHGDPYWATDHELLARAFEAYVQAKLGTKVDRGSSTTHPFKREVPELVRAFDKFFKEIKVADNVELPTGEKGKVIWGVGAGATYSLVPTESSVPKKQDI